MKFQFNLGHCIGYAKNLSFGIYWSLENQSISGGPVDLQSFLIWANPGLFLGIFIAELFNNIDFIKRLMIIGHFRTMLTWHVFASGINSAMGGSPDLPG